MNDDNPGLGAAEIAEQPKRWCDQPFAARGLFTDDEVRKILDTLPKPLIEDPACLISELAHRARTYLTLQAEEIAQKPRSKIMENIDSGVGKLSKLQLRPRDRRQSEGRRSSAHKWLIKINSNPGLLDALGVDLDDDEGLIAETLLALDGDDVEGLQNSEDYLAVAYARLEELPGDRASIRRSKAKQIFLDQLADLFERYTGTRPTHVIGPISDEKEGVTSLFFHFCNAVFRCVHPSTAPSDGEVREAVGRNKRRIPRKLCN